MTEEDITAQSLTAEQLVAMAQPALTDPPKVAKSKLEQHFHPNFVALMEAAPQNKLVLGKMMATLGVMPPQELLTFIELRNWVEMTFDDPTKKKAVPSTRDATLFPGRDEGESGCLRYVPLQPNGRS